MYLKLGSAPAVVVSSPEIAKQMLKDHDPCFAYRLRGVVIEIMWYNYVDIVFCPYGDYWRQMRKICINQLLSPRMVRALASIRSGSVGGVSAPFFRKKRESDGEDPSSIMCRAAFGKVCRDSETLIKMVMETLKLGAGFAVADLFPSSRIAYALSWAKMMRRKLDVILDDIIDEHSRNLAAMSERDSGSGRPGNSEDVLLRIKEEGQLQFPIAKDNIKAVLFDIFAGGTDTSSTVIDWAMVELMRNPGVMKKAQDEVRQVVLRENKNKNTTTTTLEEDDVHKLKYLKLIINGYTIPADVKVMVNIWGMQRDPRYWKDPERFDPERFENETLDYTGGDFEFLPFYNFNWELPKGVRPQDLEMMGPRKDNLFVVATVWSF